MFVRMGGKSEDIELRLLSDDLKGELAMILGKFDAGKARCFLHQDRQKLLAVIEAAFGTLAPFNKVVRSIFAGKLEEGRSIDAPGMGKKTTAKPKVGATEAQATDLFSVTV